MQDQYDYKSGEICEVSQIWHFVREVPLESYGYTPKVDTSKSFWKKAYTENFKSIRQFV
jgi:hypothetical protein